MPVRLRLLLCRRRGARGPRACRNLLKRWSVTTAMTKPRWPKSEGFFRTQPVSQRPSRSRQSTHYPRRPNAPPTSALPLDVPPLDASGSEGRSDRGRSGAKRGRVPARFRSLPWCFQVNGSLERLTSCPGHIRDLPADTLATVKHGRPRVQPARDPPNSTGRFTVRTGFAPGQGAVSEQRRSGFLPHPSRGLPQRDFRN